MTWHVTSSLEEFLDAAGDLLGAQPVQNNLLLTVLETLRVTGLSAYGDADPVFGWHETAGGAVDGAFLRTPPYPVLAAQLPPDPADSAAALLELLGGRGGLPDAANVLGSDEASVARAWAKVAGGSTAPRRRSRLYRLAGLVPPDPHPSGVARVASEADRDLLLSWHTAFAEEVHEPVADPERIVRDRLSYRGALLWEDDGRPVAMAALSRPVAGVLRVVAVYTPPQYRRRGYGGAATTAASKAALAAGAAEVVLFTDLANPTSNALYQRLGYRPVADRVLLRLAPAAAGAGPGAVTLPDGPSS